MMIIEQQLIVHLIKWFAVISPKQTLCYRPIHE